MRKSNAKDLRKHKPTTGVHPSRIYKPKGRSAVTNGVRLLPKIVDGRSLWVRRMRDLLALHLSDLGGEDTRSNLKGWKRHSRSLAKQHHISSNFTKERQTRCADCSRQSDYSAALRT
jgi:hypothetical protein